MRKSYQNSCSYTIDTIIPSTKVCQYKSNKGINRDYQSDHIINSNINDSVNSVKEILKKPA